MKDLNTDIQDRKVVPSGHLVDDLTAILLTEPVGGASRIPKELPAQDYSFAANPTVITEARYS